MYLYLDFWYRTFGLKLTRTKLPHVSNLACMLADIMARNRFKKKSELKDALMLVKYPIWEHFSFQVKYAKTSGGDESSLPLLTRVLF